MVDILEQARQLLLNASQDLEFDNHNNNVSWRYINDNHGTVVQMAIFTGIYKFTDQNHRKLFKLYNGQTASSNLLYDITDILSFIDRDYLSYKQFELRQGNFDNEFFKASNND